ncbi:MAG TPA: diguanylate cyclase [Mariprofundaceae bacterium]|nr:diguanylate cyclase [Mariprofundaceae bacterium]
MAKTGGGRMFEVSHKELDSILVQIDQAIDNHDQWHRQLVRTLICKLPPDQRDMAEDSHTQCRFGQWYYGQSNASLRTHPTFAAMENEHKQLHQLVARLLRASVEDTRIDAMLYDQFANTLERMRLQLFSLKYEIESELYNIDPLTGAYTRYGMLATLRDQQSLVSRGAGGCAVAMLDIDHFKEVNDQYGHHVGDRFLTHVASILIKNLRPYDKLYRYGGEEFILMLPNTSVQAAMMITERMRKLIGKSTLHTDELSIRATISVGVAMIEADNTVETAIDRADRAMYAAKREGRDRVKLWTSSLAEN